MISLRRRQGMTLIELIIVLSIIAIVSITVMPKWQAQSFGLEYEARRLLNDIRYAQALSMASGQRYRWVKNSATSYSIIDENGNSIIMPGGSTSVVLSDNVQLGSLSHLPNNLVSFSSLGVPYIASGLSATALSSTASININNGSTSRAIQITPDTGFAVLS